jgi:hypothetical protein
MANKVENFLKIGVLSTYAEKCANFQLADLNTRKISRFFYLRIKQKNCGFAICGLSHLRNLRICDGRMSLRIYGFAIREL